MKKKSIPHIELKDEEAIDLYFEKMEPSERQEFFKDLLTGKTIKLIDRDVNIKDFRPVDVAYMKKFLKNPTTKPSITYDENRHKMVARKKKAGLANYWVSPKGEAVLLQGRSHSDYAVKDILKDDKYEHYPFEKVYDLAMAKGWIRVVEGNSINIEFGKITKDALSKIKDMINDAVKMGKSVFIEDNHGHRVDAENRMDLAKAYNQLGWITASIKKKANINYWISPSGEVIPAGRSHVDYAIENIIKDERYRKYPTMDVYKTVIYKGWVRVLEKPNEIAIEFDKINEKTLRTIKEMINDSVKMGKSVFIEDMKGERYEAENKIDLAKIYGELKWASMINKILKEANWIK